MSLRARALFVILLLGSVLAPGWLAATPPAAAHPLGNFTVNRYSGIVLEPGEITLRYVLDMAEIPTFQEGAQIDANGDGRRSPAEQEKWGRGRADSILAGARLDVNDRPLVLRFRLFRLTFPPGQAGLPTLRLEVEATGVLPDAGSISYRDRNYDDRMGWREITLRSEAGVAITASSVPAASVTNELRAYPKDRLASPLDVGAAVASYRAGHPGAAGVAMVPEDAISGAPVASGGSFAGLVTRKLTPLVLALSLILAFAFGAVHALGPGHGKTITAAYLVGTDARAKHAATVGAAVALMHTASVLSLGLALFVLSHSFPPDRVYPWLTLATGAVAVGLGASLTVSRTRSLLPGKAHAHAHSHRWDPLRVAATSSRPLSGQGVLALAVSGGILPSPTALVVLTGAVSAHRLGYGLGLLVAFSLGLAASLMAVGMLAVRAGVAVSRRIHWRIAETVPVLSALVIVGFGVFFTIQGLVSLG